MILIDATDVIEVGLRHHVAFQTEWVVGSPDAIRADYADVLARGPFLLTVNDECAWAGQHGDSLYRVAGKRMDRINYNQWHGLAEIYSAAVGVSRASYLLRFASMRRKLRHESQWVPFGLIYHWPEGVDLVWSSLIDHPEIQKREHRGRREVRYV